MPTRSRGPWPPRARVVGAAPAADEPRGPPRSSIPTERRVESFADDLNTRRGIVSGRVALLPRSAEIQPFRRSDSSLPPSTLLLFTPSPSGVGRDPGPPVPRSRPGTNPARPPKRACRHRTDRGGGCASRPRIPLPVPGMREPAKDPAVGPPRSLPQTPSIASGPRPVETGNALRMPKSTHETSVRALSRPEGHDAQAGDRPGPPACCCRSRCRSSCRDPRSDWGLDME